MKAPKLPLNQKLWCVRMDYLSEGDDVKSTRSVDLTYSDAVAYRQQKLRERPDYRWTVELNPVAVAEYEEKKAQKRVASKRKAVGDS